MISNQRGSVASLGLLVFLGVALIGALIFGGWAYKGRQDYKNNSDTKTSAAVESAKKAQASELQKVFDEQQKKPSVSYKGPTTYGTITFDYPKTWSGYVDGSVSGEPINGYFYPQIVPGLQSKSAYALRVELVDSEYASILQQHDSQVKDGTAKASAYVPPKMVGVANVQPGTRFDGVLDQDITGSMVIIKVRDKTLEVYTQSNDFLSDFNNTVLPSLTFAP